MQLCDTDIFPIVAPQMVFQAGLTESQMGNTNDEWEMMPPKNGASQDSGSDATKTVPGLEKAVGSDVALTV